MPAMPQGRHPPARRTHYKSRFGCRQCKQRKVKCDEARPSCARCTSRKSTCTYVEPADRLPPPPTTRPSPSTTRPSPSPTTLSASLSSTALLDSVPPSNPASPAPSCQPSDSLLDERYSLLHLELLQHFRGPLITASLSSQPELSLVFDLTYKEAFKTPYLMDELLAFSAAHKSLVSDGDRQTYQVEATRLQTRALRQFNLAPKDVTPATCLSLFTFSTLLGQHVLFDAFSAAADGLPAVLDRLAHCIGLHHGIRAIAGRAREEACSLCEDLVPVDAVHMAADVPATTGSNCDDLLQRLRSAGLPEATLRQYEDAVKILKYLFDTSQASDMRRVTAVQEWLVRLSSDFVELLRQRRPEALIVVAYYGVLLHQARDYWPFRGAGAFLVRGISKHLGEYWEDWLRWPNGEV